MKALTRDDCSLLRQALRLAEHSLREHIAAIHKGRVEELQPDMLRYLEATATDMRKLAEELRSGGG